MNRPLVVFGWVWLAGCGLLAGAGWGLARLWAVDPWSCAALVTGLVMVWLSWPGLESSGDGSPVTHDRVT